jgi:hypothetical protein
MTSKCLILYQHSSTIHFLTQVLLPLQLDVISACNGQDALVYLNKWSFGLIIIECSRMDESLKDFLVMLEHDFAIYSLPLLLLTSEELPELLTHYPALSCLSVPLNKGKLLRSARTIASQCEQSLDVNPNQLSLFPSQGLNENAYTAVTDLTVIQNPSHSFFQWLD